MESKSLGSSIDEVPELDELLQLAAHQGLPLVLVFLLLHGMYAGAGVGAQGQREAVEHLVQAQLLRPPHPLSGCQQLKLPSYINTRACRLERAKHPSEKPEAFAFPSQDWPGSNLLAICTSS